MNDRWLHQNSMAMPCHGLSQGLFTDFYQLTMAQAYWQNGKTAKATFSLFFRKYPPGRGYFVFAGLGDILNYLCNLRFTESDLNYLRSIGIFHDGFLNYLSNLRFTGNIRAMAEGTPFFRNEPVLEVTAPIIEAQVVETMLVNQVNLQSMLASKAARVVQAAKGKTVVDFAARRAQGTDSANKLSRASYMVGFAGTSNVLGGALYSIPTFGTMAHSFVNTFEYETDAFRAYAKSFPHSSTFLVDTYDTIEGVRNAITVAREMKSKGESLKAVRLDSGDLLALSIRTRKMLDDAGLQSVEIIATGGLDEFEVENLVNSGAAIDGFGVGTKVGVSADAPWADCVYKLVEYEERPVIKLSVGKATLPGPKQVFREIGANGVYSRDLIACADEGSPKLLGTPLLNNVMKNGLKVEELPTLEDLRAQFKKEIQRVPLANKDIRSPSQYEVNISCNLESLREKLTLHKYHQTELPASTDDS